MKKLNNCEPQKVFEYFEQICSIPHGSGNMEKISTYCMDFAEKHGLKAVRDKANNVIIYKNASKGYEKSEPIILQGHLDMVCQKTEDCNINFETDGLDIYEENGFIKAHGTTLGADNGIAVAMILAILDDNTLCHPPIEAVFTTDEEVGMIGASALDPYILKGTRMINIDSENPEVVTVSCAGGCDFRAMVSFERKKSKGKILSFSVKGLKGGHSGVEINKGRVNANMLMGRILYHLLPMCSFEIISIDGGDKSNAIPVSCKANIFITEENNVETAVYNLEKYCEIIKEEISTREENFFTEISLSEICEAETVGAEMTNKLIYLLLNAPGGVVEMSTEIEGLVQTSLNMGILQTSDNETFFSFALRSNKISALDALTEKLTYFFSYFGSHITVSGQYPPWEYNPDSVLRDLYISQYEQVFGKKPAVEAIHAGLECGVFAYIKKNFDCISIGPEMHDIHTVNEKLSISSTNDIFKIIIDILKALKN